MEQITEEMVNQAASISKKSEFIVSKSSSPKLRKYNTNEPIRLQNNDSLLSSSL